MDPLENLDRNDRGSDDENEGTDVDQAYEDQHGTDVDDPYCFREIPSTSRDVSIPNPTSRPKRRKGAETSRVDVADQREEVVEPRKRKSRKRTKTGTDNSEDDQQEKAADKPKKSRRKSVRKSKSGPQETMTTAQRVSDLREDRRRRIREEIGRMSREEMENLLLQTVERRPGLIFDILHPPPPENAPPDGDVPWCTCGRCRDMPTDAERLCCGAQSEAECLNQHGVFMLLIDEAALLIQRAMYNDVLNLEGEPEEPGAEEKSNRHAAYRSFIFWQHGRLGQGNRRVIPSCCVNAIRDRYPSPNRRYTGFIRGRNV